MYVLEFEEDGSLRSDIWFKKDYFVHFDKAARLLRNEMISRLANRAYFFPLKAKPIVD
jgi:hypothetical protein